MDRSSQSNDYSEMLLALNAEGAEYIVVGAHAVAYHGRPRASKDFDVWVRATKENALRVYRAVARFGANMHNVTPQDFESDDLIFQIGVEPNRIDIITSIEGVNFEYAWPRRERGTYMGVPASVLGYDDLIANKKAARRGQDLADVEALQNLRK